MSVLNRSGDAITDSSKDKIVPSPHISGLNALIAPDDAHGFISQSKLSNMTDAAISPQRLIPIFLQRGRRNVSDRAKN
ncbi:uncharacterized protein ARMOST_08512 [Armillaria ostoyae]|uniref:Uncharacterized protein n=1 Tax=Armillaria ostoyae TaxID=47428 RepID=A0A284R8V9_ARMOS|nr:uncharacterized protein ARMOST_08512 [Armillaria ostoyae]